MAADAVPCGSHACHGLQVEGLQKVGSVWQR
jgi:hypothetical protein